MRNKNIDILKGIGIILVVFSHVKFPYGGWYASWFVQLFFIAAGYTYSKRYLDNRRGLITFVFKRIKRLYFPWVIAGSIFTIANNFLIKINILTDNSLFLDATVGNSYGLDRIYSLADIFQRLKKILLFQSTSKVLGPVWFLATLFFVEVIYAIIDCICTKVAKEHQSMAMNSIMLLIYVTGVHFTMNGIVDNSGYKLHLVALSIFLFHVGQKIRTYETVWKDQNPVLYIFLALSIIFIFRTLKVGTVRYVRGEIPGGVQLFVWSIAGWFLVYGISQVISEGKSFIADALIYIGKHTLPIMMLHLFSGKIVTYIQIKIYKEPAYMLASFPILYHDNGWWFVYSIVGVCVPLILAAGSKKIVSQISKKIKRIGKAQISL